jgi:hypothetical protein
MTRDELIKRASDAKRASKHVAMRGAFDAASPAFLVELVKDVAAFANSGGGVIVFEGPDAAGAGAAPLASADLAAVKRAIRGHTGVDLVGLESTSVSRGGVDLPALVVLAEDAPIVFAKPGTYVANDGTEKTAFAAGTIYFRHGARSVPGSGADLLAWRDRTVARFRRDWLAGIRKVVRAPAGSMVSVVSPDVADVHLGSVAAGEFTGEPGAVAIVPRNAEEIWPYRRSELLQRINEKLVGKRLNAHDIQCINWKIHVLDRPDFSYRSHHQASVQYSPAYADWIAEQMRRDPDFLRRARAEYQTAIQNKRRAERRRIARRLAVALRDRRPSH